MHHRKPALHVGEGDPESERQGKLADSLTLRMPDWMRTTLDNLAKTELRDSGEPNQLSLDAYNAGSVARELIAAGLLKHRLQHTYSEPEITQNDFPNGKPDFPEQDANDSQLRIRLPEWLKHDLTTAPHIGGDKSELSGTTSDVARKMITLGYQLYEERSLPYGEPTTPNDTVLCPGCYDETSSDAIWKRTFEYWPDIEDLWDELSTERNNPYREFIMENYGDYGWDITGFEDKIPIGVGLQTAVQNHPDVQGNATVCHCYLCGHTDDIQAFQKAWFDNQ